MQNPSPRDFWDRFITILVIGVVVLFLSLIGGYIYWVTHFHMHIVF